MSDKPKPVDDLKEGLGLLFRAAKGAVESLPTDKIEGVAKDAAKEVGRAFESLGSELEKVITGKPAQPAAPPPDANASTTANAAPPAPAPEPPKDDVKYDDGYAPEPPKGPRVG
jgi:hypothetical protein